jgi:Undecaprenyl-phosphate glucose phosphotransferase
VGAFSVVAMNFVKPDDAFRLSSDAQPPVGPRRKWPVSYGAIGTIAIACDIAVIMACGVGAGALYSLEAFGSPGDLVRYFGAATVIAVLFVALMKSRDLYNPSELLSLRNQIRDASAVWASVFLFLFGALFTLKLGDAFSRVSIFSFGIAGLGCLLLQRVVIRNVLAIGINEHKFLGRNAILVSDKPLYAGNSLVASVLKHGFYLERQYVVPVQPGEAQDRIVADIIGQLRGSDIEEVIVGFDLSNWDNLKKLFSGLRTLPLPVNVVPTGAASAILSRPARMLDNSLCVELQRGPLGTFERATKRAVDIAGAAAGLALLLPLLFIIAILIKLDSRGPILFRQQRCGFNGRPFSILKFRTMTVLEDGPTVLQAAQGDTRVTRIGRLLRRTSIDELPQLLNVVQGTMSLVGPRPHAIAHDSHFDKLVGNYAFRHHVKPGLTGWAQIHGYRGPTPTLAEIRKRVECDLWYIDNWTWRLDLRILFLTVVEVLRARNAY